MRLTQDMLDLLVAGVAHQVGACTADGRPVVSRGLAAQVEEDGRLTVVLSARAGFEVLAAIQDNGRISVTFTLPENHRTLNLSGRDAVVGIGGTRYRELVDARHATFRAQLAMFGFPPDYTGAAWYSSPDEDLAAIHFTPLTARDQTPGPGAGNAVALKS